MVIVRLKGGLGNQMFQYATGRALALRTGSRLLLDTTFLNDRTPRKHFTFRKYELGIFTLRADFTLLSRMSFVAPIPLLYPALSVLAEKVGKLFFRRTVYMKEYYQSEKYFRGYEDAIRSDFILKEVCSAETKKLALEIASTESVALHVRRGDYVSDAKTTAYHGFVGEGDYYARAVKLIGEKVKNPHFFVFSDDIAWCKAHLAIAFPTVFVSSCVDDFYLMTRAKHAIIANSSFSWWGAWLNGNSEKIVIAPKRWLQKKSYDSGNIVPVSWIKI